MKRWLQILVAIGLIISGGFLNLYELTTRGASQELWYFSGVMAFVGFFWLMILAILGITSFIRSLFKK